MTLYLCFHAISATISMLLLVRAVPCGNLIGIIAVLTCVILGPFSLFALACAAFASINSDQSEMYINHGEHDQEFYKHKHDRRHT